jgi:hypothetical protein
MIISRGPHLQCEDYTHLFVSHFMKTVDTAQQPCDWRPRTPIPVPILRYRSSIPVMSDICVLARRLNLEQLTLRDPSKCPYRDGCVAGTLAQCIDHDCKPQ